MTSRSWRPRLGYVLLGALALLSIEVSILIGAVLAGVIVFRVT